MPLFIITKNWTTQMLFNLWIFKQIVLYPRNGRLHNNKKEEIINTHNSMENHRCWVLSEKSYSHKAMYYVILSIWHFEKGKIVETKKISNSQELCVGWVVFDYKGAQRNIWRWWTVPCLNCGGGYTNISIYQTPRIAP